MAAPLQLIANTLRLSRWTLTNTRKTTFNDFYRPTRDYGLRYALYEHISKSESLEHAPVDYLEFGVGKGLSFQWWTKKNKNVRSRFYGFDTFDGLPEKWGTYSKGSMSSGVPELNDERTEFFKGLFQQTLFAILDSARLNPVHRKIIHMDADLFSSTLFVLTTLHRYLKKDDILIFDEFNVPNHEFLAFENYVKSYYVKFEVIGAVNNYFQIAIKLK